MQQQQQQQGALAASTPAKGAPAKAPSEAPLTYPPGSPAVPGSAGEDPIKLIQTMIHEAHYALTQDIERIMGEHENKLRQQIKSVLRRHAAGIDPNGPSPLDRPAGS